LEGVKPPPDPSKGETKLVGTLRNTRRTLAGPAGTRAFVAVVLALLAVLFIPRAASDPSFFVQILVYGLANGSIFALIALGYTMVYGIVELINFAHGDVFTLGGFISLWLLPIFGVTEGGTVTGAGLILPLVAILVISMVVC